MAVPVQPGQPAIKMVPVDAKMFESIGYATSTRQLFVKFRNSPMMCFQDIPGFRYSGLLNAPRKDAYFATYIKNHFLAKEVSSGSST